MLKRCSLVAFVAGFLVGCSMLTAWKTIPPPGGCDQCHELEISANWVASYRPVQLNDETDRNPWQQPESVLGPPVSERLEEQKISELRCFRCHKSPDRAHTERVGRYHH